MFPTEAANRILLLSFASLALFSLAKESGAAEPTAPSAGVEERGIERAPVPINPFPLPGLPNPIVAFTGTENYQVGGQNMVRYKLAVKNHAAYPDAIFVPAPKLPPCGANVNASRTWVDIYHATQKIYIYGFCALGSSNDLINLWFAVPAAQSPPSVVVVLNDRQMNKQYISNPVTIP